jgi:hypothetical protein
MHNSVYAYDADTPSNRLPFWKVNLGPSVPVSDWGASYRDIDFEVGILSTPVIDRVSNTLFVVTATKEPAGYFHKLHALDLMTGQEKAGSPVVIQGSVAGSGQGSVNGRIDFNSERHLQRTGLLLINGQVVIAFASHGDQTPYHGWIFAYDSATLTQTGITNTSPNSGGCGIWQAGTGLSADAQGGIYLVTGNGIGADATRPDDRSESVVKYNLTAGGFNIADWFTPFDWQTLDDQDADLGSDGPLVVPGTNLLLTGSKSGKFYLLDRNNLGKLNAGGDSQIVQSFQAVQGANNRHIHGTPIVWNGPQGTWGYVWGENDFLRAFSFENGKFTTSTASQSTMLATGGMPGGILSISSNGAQGGTGVMWASLVLSGDANQHAQPGLLRAFDATNLSHELWNSEQNPDRDSVGTFGKFVPPTIANGKVYQSTFSNQVVVFGLLSN